MKAIILAAGQSLLLDGFNKLLIKDPKSGKNVLDNYIEIFGSENITVVVGYRAIEIMSLYPQLTYIHNADWAVTNNSGSLALVDEMVPSYVLSSDFFIHQSLIEKMEAAGENLVLTAHRESRTTAALNCNMSSGCINAVYNGRVQRLTDPECMGVIKITDVNLMATWIKNCRKNSEKFVAENLEFDGPVAVENFDLGDEPFYEINKVSDYINFLSQRIGNE